MRASKTPKRTLYRQTRIGADPGDTVQRLETKRGACREPHDQHGVLAMLNTTARGQKRKREHREAKRKNYTAGVPLLVLLIPGVLDHLRTLP